MLPPALRDRISFRKGQNVVVGLVAAVLLLSAAPASAVPIISVVPSTTIVNPGGTFTVDIFLSGVTDLYSLQFELFYDPTILSIISSTPGTLLATAGTPIPFIPAFVDPFLGTALYFDSLTGLIPGASGSGTLLSLTFGALALGTSAISLVFDPTLGAGLFDSVFNPISFTTVNASVSVQPASVPESSSLLIMTFGVAAALVTARWRQRRRLLPVRS